MTIRVESGLDLAAGFGQIVEITEMPEEKDALQ